MPASDYPDDLGWLIESEQAEIAAATDQFQAGLISLAKWQARMEEILAQYETAGFMVGQVSTDIAPGAVDLVVDQLLSQLSFLAGFADDIDSSGDGSSADIPARARSYSGATAAAYWSGATQDLPLPALPGDGTTQCLSNCKCAWRIETLDTQAGNFDAYWERHVSDSCQTCVEREKQWNPLQIRDWVLT